MAGLVVGWVAGLVVGWLAGLVGELVEERGMGEKV